MDHRISLGPYLDRSPVSLSFAVLPRPTVTVNSTSEQRMLAVSIPDRLKMFQHCTLTVQESRVCSTIYVMNSVFVVSQRHVQQFVVISGKVQGVSLAIGPKVFLITFKVIDVI
jgi:hypothetical protein